MKSVSRFEQQLITILRSFLGKVPMSQALPLIQRPFPGKKPKCLSRDCIELIKQSLQIGCVDNLTRWGGWKQDSYLRNGAPKTGAVWQRTLPANLGLRFSPLIIELLIWLTYTDASDERKKWTPQSAKLKTLGDDFFIYLVVKAIRHKRLVNRFCEMSMFRDNGLICLAFPEVIADCKQQADPDFKPWVSGLGGVIVECLQAELADFWIEGEKEKSKIVDLDRMRALGEAQMVAYTRFLQAAKRQERTDIYRFLLTVGSKLLTKQSTPRQWFENLNVKGQRVADRSESYASALTLSTAMLELGKQNREFLGVSYVDDEYEASQLWKKEWERLDGNRVVEQAQRLLRETRF